MASRMPWLISSETCHQKVVQNGFPSTSDERDADRVERDLVDLEHRAPRVEQPDELHHRVERDARDLLAVALAGVGGEISVPRTVIGRLASSTDMRSAFFAATSTIVNRAPFP